MAAAKLSFCNSLFFIDKKTLAFRVRCRIRACSVDLAEGNECKRSDKTDSDKLLTDGVCISNRYNAQEGAEQTEIE